MYRVAHHVTPGQLEAIAAFLYAELLRAGYTHVCEFHYLHNDRKAALCRARRNGLGIGTCGEACGHRPDAAAHPVHALGIRCD
jgi:cytosine/adenosine deaminase-related metal-dependent hydrolase